MHWKGSLTIDRPDTEVYLALSDLHEVAQWSAWLAYAGKPPEVIGDGTAFGSTVVLGHGRGSGAGSSQGRVQLLLVSARLGRVELLLSRQGAGGSSGMGRRPLELDLIYRLQDVGASATIVMLDAHSRTRPSGVARPWAEARLRRRLDALAVSDLQRLRAHVEGRQLGS